MEGEDIKKEKLCFLSYNSRGFGTLKIDFIKYLASTKVVGNKLPIICNQENFLLRDNSYKLTRALPNFQVFINSAIKNSHDSGRPKNGMFIAVPQSIKNYVTDVSPGFWRIQAVTINLGTKTTLQVILTG